MRNLTLVLALMVLMLGAASMWLQGPLPFDIEITKALQAFIPAGSAWIDYLSITAGWPGIIVSGLVVAVFAASLAGLRGAAAALVGMVLAMAMERGLRMFVLVPRPSSELVDVAKLSASSGLPSTFAMFFGAACGALIALAWGKRGCEAVLVRSGAASLLVIGCAGRIAAGGHWTSQVLPSAAAGVLASLLALRLFGLRR
ncbi:phosphatase PAP2 family protein [Blastomonas aquatica]|uniref:Phosphatidic acid phosphatase type 2/haloperoxidase domain-containing protein n=1 Tax=Blastomonas aquatica TaxID=1510276 RepID=A0ABQ1JPY2_9SPHN|nr:phosphatase PAP2 family protein [Blastomonas aquatica]GGB71337.1 hypothetical protein GCM10010833_28170 [Blastomonas aquatica]